MIKLIYAMIIWGTIGIFSLWSGLSALELTFFRCLIGAGIVGSYCFKKGYFTHPSLTSNNFFFAALSGVFIVTNWIFLFKSFQISSITIGNVSYYLQPIFLVLLSIFFFQEAVSFKQWIFILITTLGIVFTSHIQPYNFELTNPSLLGIGFAISAGFLYSFSTIFVKFIKEMPPSLITFIQLSIGFIIMLPLVHLSTLLHHNLFTWAIILFIGTIHTALAYLLYYQSIKEVNLTVIAIVSYLDPIVAIITDIVFCDRSLNALQIIGIILTFIGSYQVIRLKKPVEVGPKTIGFET